MSRIFHSGFVSIVGRPNAGKSTLLTAPRLPDTARGTGAHLKNRAEHARMSRIFHSGFVSIVGRPNAEKSTLLTRTAIQGVLRLPDTVRPTGAHLETEQSTPE